MTKKILYYNNKNGAGVIIRNKNGGIEFKIIGNLGEYKTVAEIPSPKNNSTITRDAKHFKNVFRYWFGRHDYSLRYAHRAKRGETDPFRTWQRLRRGYNLPDTYDIKPDNQSKEVGDSKKQLELRFT